MFAVSEKETSEPNIVGIYPTRQEAEEILYTMAEEDIYKLYTDIINSKVVEEY